MRYKSEGSGRGEGKQVIGVGFFCGGGAKWLDHNGRFHSFRGRVGGVCCLLHHQVVLGHVSEVFREPVRGSFSVSMASLTMQSIYLVIMVRMEALWN
jgi:hypothetical protein